MSELAHLCPRCASAGAAVGVEPHQSEHWPMIVREYRAGFFAGLLIGIIVSAVIAAVLML